MPERDKAVDAVARILSDAPHRPALDRLGTCPEGMDPETWEKARQTAEAVYVEVIEGIDFQRLLIQAAGRHLAVHPGKSVFMSAAEIGFTSRDDLCDECLREVLLATSTHPSWTEQPEADRYVIRPLPTFEPLTPPDGV